MGVITVAYSITANMLRKIRNDNENLAYIKEPEDENSRWKVEELDFDSGIEPTISILREVGCPKTAKNLNCEYADLDLFDYNGYDIWTVSPSQVAAMLKELEKVNVKELIAKGNVNEVTDRRGAVLQESLYESYVSDLVSIKKFIKQTVEEGNYLLFTEA